MPGAAGSIQRRAARRRAQPQLGLVLVWFTLRRPEEVEILRHAVNHSCCDEHSSSRKCELGVVELVGVSASDWPYNPAPLEIPLQGSA